MSLSNIKIVLVEPIYGGNIGSVCRAMANTDIENLVIVGTEKKDIDMKELKSMACHAIDIFDRCIFVKTLNEAVSDCAMVVGTTARGGLYRQHAVVPKEISPVILSVAQTSKVAYVFGRETDGLTNEELTLCTHIVRIPSSESYKSLNLAQAVMICCYELFVTSGTYVLPAEESPLASSGLKERMFSLLRKALLRIGFMDEQKADHMMHGIRRVLNRGVKTINDARIIMGIAQQTLWIADKSDKKVDD